MKTLKKLFIGDETIEAVEGKTTYEKVVGRSVENIFINAQTTDSLASLVGTGQKSLVIGDNLFELNNGVLDEIISFLFPSNIFNFNFTNIIFAKQFDNIT